MTNTVPRLASRTSTIGARLTAYIKHPREFLKSQWRPSKARPCDSITAGPAELIDIRISANCLS
jgi:hypothetical protein